MKLKGNLNHKDHKGHKGINCGIEEENIDIKLKPLRSLCPLLLNSWASGVWALCALCFNRGVNVG